MATPRTVKGIDNDAWASITAHAAAAGLTIGQYFIALDQRAEGEPITILNPRQPRHEREERHATRASAADLDHAERLVKLGIEAGGRATHAARRLAVALIDAAAPAVATLTPPPLVALPAPATAEVEAA